MYERFFGLVDAPFRLTPDPRYLFLSRKHAEALAHLRLGLAETSGFVCITGDVGTGKTTLLRAFLDEIGPDVATAYIFNPTLSPLELVRRVNRELGLTSDGTPMELLDALNAHLVGQRKAGRLAVVVIDEAQAFSIEVLEQLRLLSNLETTTEKLLRVVLVGQPQLRTLLLDPALVQLNQRITLRWHLGPLARRETAAYVRHRLEVASRGKAGPVFTAPAVRLVHRFSGGVPRLINLVAHRAMLAAFVARRRTVTARIVRRAHRELEVVPLPQTPRAARRVAWAAAAAGAVGVAALGAPRLAGLASLGGIGGSPTPATTPAPLTPPVPVVPAALPEPLALAPPPVVALAPISLAPVEAPAVAEPKATPPAIATSEEIAARLAALDPAASVLAATTAVLAAWRVRPLGDDETPLPEALERVGRKRGLEDLRLTGNLSMLRLLDLPALLELRLPHADGLRWVALVGADEEKVALSVDGAPVVLEAEFLERFWFGEARVLWRDFEGLGPTLREGAIGDPVTRLQRLLRRMGVEAVEPTGQYDAATAAAVTGFQRSRLLTVDGRVGRLTRIVLYAAAGGYARPTLLRHPGGAS
jgi:general secretion pathway protein A